MSKPEPPTIASALSLASKLLQDLSNYRLEGELLLAALLQVPRSFLYSHSDQLLSLDEFNNFQFLCRERARGIPLAYLVGKKEFWSLELEVNDSTLIPRPETELLVELALQKLDNNAPLTIADLGVGSGAVAIALAKERPMWSIVATDNSKAALNVAKRNMAKHGVRNITLILSDWFQQLSGYQFDAIVSNPPYIALHDEHLKDLAHEPKYALVSGEDGLDALRLIIQNAGHYLKHHGLLLLEHGFNQATQVRELLRAAGFATIESHRDLSGTERVTGGVFKHANDRLSK